MVNLRLCPHCVLGLESREGPQPVIPVSIDPDDIEAKCDWCGDTADEGGFDELFELIYN